MPTKRIQDLMPSDPIDPIQTVTINRADVIDRPDLNHYFKRIWNLRRDFLISSYGRAQPTIVLISHKMEYDIMSAGYREKSISSEWSGLMRNQPSGKRELFGMRLIVSNDVEENEIIIK
jgi:hypothetical protein